MKKNVFKAIALSLLIGMASCKDDDPVAEQPDQNPTPTGQASVVLNEVQYLGNGVEIFNNGDLPVDLSDYWLCLGPGQYSRIGALTTVGNVTLGTGEYLSISYEMPESEGGLGLYSTNDFTNADAMVDFVQWGASGAARENVAVDANLWTAGEFVAVSDNADNSIIFDGEGNGASNWAETTSVTLGAENVLTLPMEARRSIVLNEVQYGNLNQIEIYNNGDLTVDLSSYWLCLGPGQYQQLGGADIVSGDVNLVSGEFLVVRYALPDDQGGLGLYSNDQFTNSESIMDFVQWGAAGAARENVAVGAGIWTDGDFVPVVGQSASIEYDGEGDASSDWTEEAIPSLGEANDAAARTTTFSVTITNAAEIFNVHTFSERLRGSEAPTRGPLNQNGDRYQISFQAVPGTKFTPITMMGNSNDWILAPEDLAGIPLWDELDYAAATGEAGTFTFTIEAIRTPQPAAERGVILSEVQYQGVDYVEIFNTGSTTVDLSNYWLCLGPGEYSRIGTLTPVNGAINLAAGEAVTLPFAMSDNEGLGLYNSSSFTDSNALVDFVQWGGANNPRENVAVAAGVWAAGDFLPTVGADTNSIINNGNASGLA